MGKLIFHLVLAVGLVSAQLNFEGNPLTEDTEYTAEETRVSRRTAKQEKPEANFTDRVTEPGQKLSPPFPEDAARRLESSSLGGTNTTAVKGRIWENVHDELQPPVATVEIVPRNEHARYLPGNSYNRDGGSASQADLALNTFLNSKTPEESRASLDSYLKSKEYAHSQELQLQQHAALQQRQHQQMLSPSGGQQQQMLSPTGGQQLLPPTASQQLLLTQQSLPQTQPNPHLFRQQGIQHYPMESPTGMGIGNVQPMPGTPYAPSGPTGIQSRNDFFYPGGWQRVRRIRGRPIPFAQSRLGPPLYKGPVPLKQHGPVEIIYTRPPGFHRGPVPVSNPPVPYEDASAWFPDMDHPPSPKDVYYSQLYAQSYDPHYYRYIAKTGKIRPHLYGKLGKHEEKEDDIWTELYRGFKKHGLKNLMTPTFLLGMTLPVVTLMLTALVQKRSLARADSRDLHDEAMQEYLGRAQRAMECYERKRTKRDSAGADGC